MDRRQPRFRLFLLTGALVGLIWVGFGDRMLTHWAYAYERGRIQANSEELIESETLRELHALSRAFRLVARVARPGVVSIDVRGSTDLSNIDADTLREFADRFGISPEQARNLIEQQRRRRVSGTGSGVVFDDQGHILTNNHVVADRGEIVVELPDGRTSDAILVGTDEKTDLAVIRIDAANVHPLAFGNSDDVDVGDWVIAVGAPFGLSQTVTHGIISAIGRTSIRGVNILYQNFIQTDAAINPGNSGGPLLNLRGEVIGINTAIATHGEANAGIAFTIPSNMARKVAEQIIATGKVARGWLGVTMRLEPLDEQFVEIFDLPAPRGVFIERVLNDSPAARYGVQVEDVVIAINDEPVRNADYFRGMIADIGPNEVAKLTVIRDGEEKQLDVKLALQPADLGASVLQGGGGVTDTREVPLLGLRAQSLYPGVDVAYPELERGVYINAISTKAPAARELDPREVIAGVNGEPVENVGQLNEILQSIGPDRRVRLQIIEPDGDRRIDHVRTGR